MTLGQKLISLRKARGMTQEELSEAIGVTRQTISKWELDTSTPDLDYLCKLCDLFGVTADYLIRPNTETQSVPFTPPPAPSPSAKAEAQILPPPTPSTHTEKSKKAPLNTRPAGFVLLDVAIFFFIFGMISLFTQNQMPEMFLLGGIALIFSLELLLIRRKPLFIVMWTAWVLWTGSQAILTGRRLFSLIFFLHYEATLPVNWTWIFATLWLLYTALCIGVTVGMIVKHLRKKKTQQP